jgi:hypothetical protein
MECADPRNNQIVEKLTHDVILWSAIDYLTDRKIAFSLYDAHDQEILPDKRAGRRSEKVIGEAEIIVMSGVISKSFLVEGRELLELRFDENGRLISTGCKKMYTGP